MLPTCARRWWLVPILLAPLALASPRPQAPDTGGLAPERVQPLDRLLADAVEKKQIAGGVALLARDGRVVYLRAAGQADVEAGRAMTPDTIFRIASMTKPITSAAALMLADEGRLALTDPVSRFIPEFRGQKVLVPKDGGFDTVPAEREVTVRDLLTHTSGVCYSFFAPKYLGDLYREAGVEDGVVQTELTLEENVRRLARLPLAHQPGRAFTYGLNTDVLGRVVEVAAGQDLDTVFRTRIFEPLSLRDTSFWLPDQKKARLAALYRPGPDKTIQRVGEEPVQIGNLRYSASFQYSGPKRHCSGCAGLVSTAADYARFLQMLLNGGELDGVRLLKPETVRQMTANQIGELRIAGPHGDRFGYGFGVVTAKSAAMPMSVGSYSWGGLFNTFFWVDPERRLVGVLLTQLYPYDHLPLRGDFLKQVYAVLEK
jgi:CubicO group peptidase (beta-lactamase class C family)